MEWLDVDVAVTVLVNSVHLMDDTDFKTREESVVFDQAGLDLKWVFCTTAGVITSTTITPTDTAGVYDWTNIGNGFYKIEIPASGGGTINNDTEGFGFFEGFATGILPWRGPTYGFRAVGLNNLLVDNAFSATRALAGTALPDAVADAAAGLPVSAAGGLDLDAMNTNINDIEIFVDLIDDGTSGLAKIATDVAAILVDTAVWGAAGSEPTGVPAVNETPLVKIDYLFMALRNKLTVTATKKQFFDDGGLAEWEKDVSDDGTTYTETEANVI